MEDTKKMGPGPEGNDGPPPIDIMYKGIPKLTSAEIPEKGETQADVVIVGCGGSGIPAAVSAFENGAGKVKNRKEPVEIPSWQEGFLHVKAPCCGRRWLNRIKMRSLPMR